MFVYKVPTFAPGPMRPEILHTMRDLPLFEQLARYEAYRDGVIYGCDLFESNMNIGISNGLVKYGGRVYVQTEKDSVHYEPTDEWTVLKIRFHEATERDFVQHKGQLVLDSNTHILPNEMEMGRFKLKQGARLRTEYTDFYDMETEYDTVNLIYVNQAATQNPTLHHMIIHRFATEAYPYAETAIDIAFCTACLAGREPVQRQFIQQYICKKMDKEYHEMPNEAIYRHLTDILRQIRREKSGFGTGALNRDGIIMM